MDDLFLKFIDGNGETVSARKTCVKENAEVEVLQGNGNSWNQYNI